MRKGILSKSIIVIGLFGFFVSCKSTKAIGTAGMPPKSVPADLATGINPNLNTARTEKIAAVKSHEINFATLSGKARAALSISGNSNDVTMNIRMKKDAVIWVSITAIAGLEVARALITPDSVRVINRLENEYITKPFSYLYEFTNNKINFATLQSVMLGNMISEFITDSTHVDLSGAQAELNSSMGSLIYELMVNEQNKVVQSKLIDSGAAQSLVVNYGDFQATSQEAFPHSIIMKSQAKNKSINLDLKFTKVELNVPVEIPFRVPDRYTIKN